MKKIKTEVIVLGSGSTAVLAASWLASRGIPCVFVNPKNDYNIEDLRPSTGLGLWNAAYRSEKKPSLPDLYDELVIRLKDFFPAPIEHVELSKTSHWGILSSTFFHRAVTDRMEKDFFRIEKKDWSSNHIRLLNPEHLYLAGKQIGIDFSKVAKIEGGIQRSYAIHWNAVKMGQYLHQYVQHKISQSSEIQWIKSAKIKARYGKKIVIEAQDGELLDVECKQAMLVLLTGEMLPELKTIVASCDEPWIQGVRKKRRENHWAHFERMRTDHSRPIEMPGIWFELGKSQSFWNSEKAMTTWQSTKGPDGFEKVVDESLRMQVSHCEQLQLFHSIRSFQLEWEWKNPQWRKTNYDTYWATAFEGDLWNIMEIIWNLPLQ